jgi:hypothetical protein
MTVATARAALAPLRLAVSVTGGAGGTVRSQLPRPGVAAAPGMRVVLNVRRPGTAG